MTHFSSVFHKASGTLAMSEMQHEQPLSLMNAKQRRLSRPNTIEEIRVRRQKRKLRKNKEEQKMSKKAKRMKARKLDLKKKKIEELFEQATIYGEEQRKRAIYFWKKWREERRPDDSQYM